MSTLQNIKLLFLVFFIIILSGCASTVRDVMNTEPVIMKSVNSPRFVANCIMQNIDNDFASFSPILRETEKKGDLVLHIRGKANIGNAAIVEINQTDTGSIIKFRVSNHYVFGDAITGALMKGCLI